MSSRRILCRLSDCAQPVDRFDLTVYVPDERARQAPV